MKNLALLILTALPLAAAFGAEQDTRCFELRTYYAAPGKLDALHARFRDHTMNIFEKHGMSNIGYWVPGENTENKLIYLLAFPSRDAQRKSWKEFGGDPDWKAAQKASEVNGPLVTKVESRLLSATDYSPKTAASAGSSAEPRLFELREYTAAPERLDALNARFREHTVALFQKAGMSNFGYWVPMKGQKGETNTLIYILAHKDRASADASWRKFHDDPDWNAAKKASEEKAGGPLTVDKGVKSTFMKPTDYSPTK
jgi:hypothetical protein